MLETHADRPLTARLTVKRDFVHSEIGARADLRMDKVELKDAIDSALHPKTKIRRDESSPFAASDPFSLSPI